MQTAPLQKKKYVMEEFVSANKANPIINTYSLDKHCLTCICEGKDSIGLTCFKCKLQVHACLAPKYNREDKYQCASCLNRALDPLIQVRKVLVESYFKTFPIFEYINIINFEFVLTQDDLAFPVEVRGLFPESTALSWPMQGAFYINDEKGSLHELKPLLYNSNRKHRREEYFSIPADKLKFGKNFIRFKIPCLDRGRFTAKYQHEDRKIYYMAVNSVIRLSPADLETQTFRERRVEKVESIKILKSNNADIEVVKNKVCLVCPYTRERIKVPVRGRYCKHFSCICLQTLIVTHAASRHWGCPICELKMNEPYVDVWIYNMLKDNQQGSEVTVKEDGSYEWVKVDSSAVMNLESDEESSPPAPNPQPQQKTEIKPEPPLKKQVQKEVREEGQSIPESINVISLDDDDDEEKQRLRKQSDMKREMIKKVKDKLKESRIEQPSKSIEKRESKKGKEAKDEKEGEDLRRKEDRPIPKPRPPMLSEIKLLECKEMKSEEFKKLFFKSKFNPYRKYVQSEELKRLFKDIL